MRTTAAPQPPAPGSVAPSPTIGVLALQGDFREHCNALRRLSVSPIEVRLPVDLDGLDGLIIPGGESTTISKLMREYGLAEPVRGFTNSGNAVWGTCAGAIVIARNATDLAGLDPLGLIDIDVRRNAFGRQVDSFHEDLSVAAIPGPDPFPGVFIRAPAIDRTGSEVEVLTTASSAGAVAVRQGQVIATTFHPELTVDTRFHALFVKMAARETTTPL